MKPAERRFQIPPPKYVTGLRDPILSPDGRFLVFAAQSAEVRTILWICRLDTSEWQPLPGTDSLGALRLWCPAFWSPDSRYIGFAADGNLKKVDISGGPPHVLCDLEFPALWSGGAWSSRGMIVFGRGMGPLFCVPESGGTPVALEHIQPQHRSSICLPAFLPDGQHFLYFEIVSEAGSFIRLGSLDAKASLPISKRLLMAADSGPVYAPGPERGMGHVIFTRKETLMAEPLSAENLQALDRASLALAGEAVPIAEGFGPRSTRMYTASTTGILAYVSGARAGQYITELTWIDWQGKALGNVGESGVYSSFALSPDGTRVAVSRDDVQAQGRERGPHIWVHELASGNTTPLSFNAKAPAWSPDGSHIAFSKWLPPHLYAKASSGAGSEDALLQSGDFSKKVQDWSSDGRFLLYSVDRPPLVHGVYSLDLWVLPLEGDREPMPYLKSEFNGGHARFSPDGRFIAYSSNESGKNEVYVQPFPIASGGKWMVSEGGGVQPHWRADGKELFYISADSRMMAVEVSTSPEFDHGTPKALFAAPIFGGGEGNFTRYDVTADGKRFLINTPGPAPPITVVLNWQAALKK